jgi:hypothetical protein
LDRVCNRDVRRRFHFHSHVPIVRFANDVCGYDVNIHYAKIYLHPASRADIEASSSAFGNEFYTIDGDRHEPGDGGEFYGVSNRHHNDAHHCNADYISHKYGYHTPHEFSNQTRGDNPNCRSDNHE